jgi:deoxyribonuclease-4
MRICDTGRSDAHRGSHVCGGGVSKAVERAHSTACEALQIFTRNANQWKGKPLDPLEITAFQEAIAATGINARACHTP